MTYPFGKLLIGLLLHKKGWHLPFASGNKILTPLNILRRFKLCPLLIIILNLRLILKIKTLFLKIISAVWLTVISRGLPSCLIADLLSLLWLAGAATRAA